MTCNSVTPRRVLTANTSATINSILQGVVTQGTGRQAALPGRPVAGKTGTTENYGDAWFVGYTPQLVTAVWVGYPNKLVPMTSQFHGAPVAGGTFPALIWKAFMEKALKHISGGDRVEYFPPAPSMYGTAQQVVWRDGRIELDNGNCRESASLQFFSGRAPSKRANCKPNEVEVPSVVGKTIAYARLRLSAQPLTPKYVFKPAKPKQRLDIVIAQYPSHGTLSSYDDVTLVLPRALHGVVPNVVGLDLRHARQKLQRAAAERPRRPVLGRARGTRRLAGSAGVAAAPHMKVSLVVARG